MSGVLRKVWRRLFQRETPTLSEQHYAAEKLKRLSVDPWACEMLAKQLDIEIDPGESAASYIADACRAAVIEHEVAYYQQQIQRLKPTSHGAGVKE